jgi:hypothetical protein
MPPATPPRDWLVGSSPRWLVASPTRWLASARLSLQCVCPHVGERSTTRRSQSCQCLVSAPRSEARAPFDVDVRLPSRGRGERSTRRPAGWSARPWTTSRRCGVPGAAFSVSALPWASVQQRDVPRAASAWCLLPGARRARRSTSMSAWLPSIGRAFDETSPKVGGASFDGAALVPGAASDGAQASVRLLSRRRAFDDTSPGGDGRGSVRCSYPKQRPTAALVPGAAFDSAHPSVCSWRRASDETSRRLGEEAAFDVAALVLGTATGVRRRPAFSSLVRAFCYETFPELP